MTNERPQTASPEPRCDMTDLLVSACPHCHPPPPPDRDAGEYGPWFTATFDSNCDDCGDRMYAGDEIRSDGGGGWICGTCGDDDA